MKDNDSSLRSGSGCGGWARWKVGFGEQTSCRPDVGTPTPTAICSLSVVVMEDLQTAALGSYGASGSSRLATAGQPVVLRRLDGVRLVVLLEGPAALEGSSGDGCSQWVGCHCATE